jgi:hypothetical protein
MKFFIRQYLRGQKGSGTQDVHTSDSPISYDEFKEISESNGVGNYLLCARGKGIRGFKKLDEYLCESPSLIFNAETVSVKQNINLEELSSEEILSLFGNMIKSAPNDAEGQQKFLSDLESFHAELESRNLEQGVVKDAEQPLVSAGFPIGTTVTSFVMGALAGGIVVWLVQKNTIDDLKSQISQLEGSIKDAEESISKVKKQADSLERRNAKTLDDHFLDSYNRMNGWKHRG